MKELEYSQDFSHYKSMGIFPDAQGQLTLQSFVRSGQISNSFEILWMSSLPASMKKIRSKMKAIERCDYIAKRSPFREKDSFSRKGLSKIRKGVLFPD